MSGPGKTPRDGRRGAPGERSGSTERTRARASWLMTGVRYVLPAITVAVGIVFMALGSESDLEGGASIVSAGLAVYFLNWLFRLGVAGDAEREREDAARAYFDEHGRWPS